MKERWEEWQVRWCWIMEENPPEFCWGVRRELLLCSADWSDLDPNDKKFSIATTRICRLTEAGITLEMIAADFICRRIAPLHKKGRSAWDFRNAADIMRLRTGLQNNLTMLGHSWYCWRLFHLDVYTDGKVERTSKAAKSGKVVKGPLFGLPPGVVPLSNNSR